MSSVLRATMASPERSAANNRPIVPFSVIGRTFGRDTYSLADKNHSVSVAPTAASINRSAALSRCQRSRSYSDEDILGGGFESRAPMLEAARTIARRIRLKK